MGKYEAMITLKQPAEIPRTANTTLSGILILIGEREREEIIKRHE